MMGDEVQYSNVLKTYDAQSLLWLLTISVQVTKIWTRGKLLFIQLNFDAIQNLNIWIFHKIIKK